MGKLRSMKRIPHFNQIECFSGIVVKINLSWPLEPTVRRIIWNNVEHDCIQLLSHQESRDMVCGDLGLYVDTDVTNSVTEAPVFGTVNVDSCRNTRVGSFQFVPYIGYDCRNPATGEIECLTLSFFEGSYIGDASCSCENFFDENFPSPSNFFSIASELMYCRLPDPENK